MAKQIPNQGNLLDFEGPLFRADDVETAKGAQTPTDAASRAGHRTLVLRALLLHGPSDDYELEALTGVQQNSIGKRRLDLQRAGLVRYSGHTNKRGRREIRVHELTEKGAEYARSLTMP